jgi:endonuclease III
MPTPTLNPSPADRRRVRAIRDRLRLVYGIPRNPPHGHPIAELILTVLSQSTNDRNRDVAYLALRERWPEWTDVRDAPVDEIEEAIRPGGISRVKSARIKAILNAITETSPPDDSRAAQSGEAGRRAGGKRERSLSLDWLAGQPGTAGSGGQVAGSGRQVAGSGGQVAASRGQVAGSGRQVAGSGGQVAGSGRKVAEAQEYLTALPGVGRKTAACVLLFALGMRDVPVDTHVSRVGTRLGLFRPKAPFEELHDRLLELTPPGQELEFHLNLLRHGRRTCHARRPDCGGCPLRRLCPRVGLE